VRRFALIGNPLGHSLSPALFGLWFRRHRIEADYRAIAATEGDLGHVLERLQSGELAGANVTVPLKERVCRKLTNLDTAARAIGAVNTLCPADGLVLGCNTDAPALAETLKSLLPETARRRTTACIFGSGGAARAAVYALIGLGFEDIRLVARNASAGAEIRRMGGGIETVTWQNAISAVAGAALVINATPLGTAGFPPFPPLALPPRRDGVALDLVYNPPRTAFQDATEAAGYRTANGFAILVGQAALAFEVWFGFSPERADITFDALMKEGEQAKE
jgi:shikimate dehydrogenase